MIAVERPVTILNVNDDAATRYVMTNILRKGGYVVLEAACGLEALAVAARERPDLVLLDVKLPDISGLEVCRRIKADPKLCSTLVVQTSATFASAERRVEGLDSGADAYLAQPIERLELLATVRAMLRTQRAEAAERRSGRKLQRTFDSIQDPVLIVDEDGAVAHCNGAAERLLGDECSNLVGLRLADLLAASVGAPAIVELLERSQGGRSELDCSITDRSYRVSADPIRDDDGATEGVVVILSDITVRKRLDEAHRARANELADDSRRKDEFLGMLAHELRNPLNAIGAANSVLERGAEARSRRLHDIIHRQTRNLARMVDDLLEVSRITRGQLQLRRHPIDLVDVIRRAADALRPDFEARNQRIALSLPAHPVVLSADDLRLEQVMMNLLANAAKYSEPGSVATVELFERATPEPHVELVVRDEGIGIPRDMLGKIFEPFVQVDQSLSRSLGGLGIGLMMVRSLVVLHGGEVDAASDGVGRGSAFAVRLPLVAGVRLEEVERAPARTVASDETLDILVVEDNEETLELIQIVLSELGHSVQGASDGIEGLRVATSMAPDVALVDIGLPGIDGYELAKRLRAVDVERRVFLVAVTGYGRPEDKARALDAGFDHYIVKPIDRKVLADVLELRPRDQRRKRPATSDTIAITTNT